MFKQTKSEVEDRAKASVLAQALQEKFAKDVGIVDGLKSDSEVVATLNRWIHDGFRPIPTFRS